MEQHSDVASSREGFDRAIARLAATRHGVFSRSQAIKLGATRGLIARRIANARWESLYQGVYRLAGTASTYRQRLLAACLAAGSGAVASHRSAGAIKQLPRMPDGIVELSVPRTRRVTHAGIKIHHVGVLPTADTTVVDGIPVTTVTRTLIDLAAVVSVDIVEEALDDALRRGLTSVRRLRRRLDELNPRGRTGTGALRVLLDARATGATPESVLETRLLRHLRRARLPLPVCQFPIRHDGRIVAVVDFAYPDKRVAIEVDGYRWHSGRGRWQSDLARRNALAALGWRVIHATSTDMTRPAALLSTILEALDLG